MLYTKLIEDHFIAIVSLPHICDDDDDDALDAYLLSSPLPPSMFPSLV
jgi:hypothetical protein